MALLPPSNVLALILKRNPNYQPSSINRTYNGPAMPIAYQDDWQVMNNLTPYQIIWFEAQPQWKNFLAYVALSPATASAGTPAAVVNAALQAAGQTPMPPIVVNPPEPPPIPHPGPHHP